MKIVGCDLHTRYQQIAMLDEETGELIESRLEHANGEAKQFYAQLTGPVRVGIEGRWPGFPPSECSQSDFFSEARNVIAHAARRRASSRTLLA